MALLQAVFVVAVVLALAICALACRVPAPAGGPTTWGPELAAHLRRLPAAVLVLALGWGVTLAVLVPIGTAGRDSLRHFDAPIQRWVAARAGGAGDPFRKAVETLTIMGNRNVVEIVVLAGLVILAVAYGPRRWWLPVVFILVAFVMQREAQDLLAHLVHRNHPPAPDAGVFPSGGASRLFIDYGTIALLAVDLLPGPSRRIWRRRAVAGIVFFSTVEALTRVYLSAHWTTDALGGLLLGGLLLTVVATALAAVTEPEAQATATTPNSAGDARSSWQGNTRTL